MESIGDFLIQKSLGEGALGSVYLAEHRFIKRKFALKILPQEISNDPFFIRRLEKEIAQIANLDHPNIIKIHNVSYSDGLYFIVSDPCVDGFDASMNLDRYLELKGQSLSEDDIIQILQKIAAALDFAHEKNLIHGGLKLTNILVSQNNNDIQFLLSDFGLSHLIGEKVALSRILQQLGENYPQKNFVQSYAFLAAEQKTGEISPKVDVFAFGALTYYLLLRKLPEGVFPLPCQMNPELKKNWDYLIERCLQMNPALRPKKLVIALQEFLEAPRALKEAISLAAVEPKIENIHQMAFDLQPASQEVLKPVLKPAEIKRPEYEPDPGAIFQRETTVSHYTPNKVETQEIEPLLTEMIIVPQGLYYRGSQEGARDEMPRHAVKLSSFAIDVHPVTNEQFVRFLQAMGGEKDHNNNDIIRLRDSRIKRSAGKLIIESGYAKHPVVGVTWYGATAYAKWIGKRLPTEAEWEAAASAGKEMIYPTGSEIERSQANFFSADTTAVMSYPANGFGLYDIAGNVYEWCQDWYAYNYYEVSSAEPDDPKGPPQGVYRVIKGGCWKSLKEDLRCSHRNRNNPGAMNGTYGFRCAADVS